MTADLQSLATSLGPRIAKVRELLNERLKVCDEATPGPWRSFRNRHPECSGASWGWIEKTGLSVSVAYWSNDRSSTSESNARFCAASRTERPQELRALIGMLDQCTHVLGYIVIAGSPQHLNVLSEMAERLVEIAERALRGE